MPRKKKDADLDKKLSLYLKEFELDDMNESNDRTTLIQMCQIEINIEKIQNALKEVDAVQDPKKVKELSTSIKDLTESWRKLQDMLKICRKNRSSESDDDPFKYIERLKENAQIYMNSRLIPLKRPDCNMNVAKYHVYVDKRGEEGAIAFEDKEIEPVRFLIDVECSKCGKMVSSSSKNYGEPFIKETVVIDK